MTGKNWRKDQEFRFGYVKFEKAIRHLNEVVKLDRGICSLGARPEDRNLRTLKF